MSSFHGSSLDAMLRDLGAIDVAVAVGGNMAVERTARDAADLGYALTTIAAIADTAAVAADLAAAAA